ncbi:lactonase family protein [Scleromatobacter humisilvae]|uniref:Lactonase family protein n=1 Tax=Scleromatobacter humisilvae TaxID=2897159 RepID=A0A9X2BY80_9BURK|nr:lactonase family protein [Scleromatobacter humisilvae]MCK9685353.1 lactonase family protein [Scleromatobacter humisilvae]
MAPISLPRRCAAGVAVALSLAGCASVPPPDCAPARLAYVGTDSGQLQALRLDACNGRLTSLGTVAQLIKPRWSVADPVHGVLYVADDIAGHDGRIVAFAIDRDTGALAKIGDADAGGIGTTHLWLDAPSSTLIAANFFSGSATTMPLAADGSVGGVASTVTETGSGPTRRQTKAHAHGVALDPTGHHALVTDLGADRVFVYGFDGGTHALRPDDAAQSHAYTVAPGSGPHHAVFSPDGRFAYVLDELSADVQALRWDAREARLSTLQSLAVSSADFKGAKSGAEIALSPDGRFVYVADRGENTVVAYRRDAATGELVWLQRIASGGDMPWGFAIDPSGHWMLVANSARVSLLRIDPATGTISDSGEAVDSAVPLSVSFLP